MEWGGGVSYTVEK